MQGERAKERGWGGKNTKRFFMSRLCSERLIRLTFERSQEALMLALCSMLQLLLFVKRVACASIYYDTIVVYIVHPRDPVLARKSAQCALKCACVRVRAEVYRLQQRCALVQGAAWSWPFPGPANPAGSAVCLAPVPVTSCTSSILAPAGAEHSQSPSFAP